MDGFLLVDKEKGATSFDVVKKIRVLTRESGVGHAGTLDPLATGLLVLALGEATKLLEYFVGCDKEYEVAAYFGKISDTYDADGKIVSVDEKAYRSSEDIEAVIKEKFIGEISQIPPKYSALKINGKRAYEMARKGENIVMKPRKVKIFRFDIHEFDWPTVSFRVKCGSGTYVRSLIHDLGRELKCGAYVAESRRTKVGNFSMENAYEIDELSQWSVYEIEKKLISLEILGKEFKRADISEDEYDALKNGKTLPNKKLDQSEGAKQVYGAYCNGFLAGIVEADKNGTGIKFRKMIVR